MKDEPPNSITRSDTTASGGDAVGPPIFNPDAYRGDLEESDLTKEQQNAVLEALWHIMSTMVNIGWGVDTVQMFLPDLFEKTGQDSGNLLEQNHPEIFNRSAGNGAEKGECV